MAEAIPIPTHQKFQDLTGRVFGRLAVLHYVGRAKNRSSKWECRCECGNRHIVISGLLVAGKCQSCGCLQRELLGNRMRRHGRSRSPEHLAWKGMRRRCNCLGDVNYKNYGGRGICICDRWSTFEMFYADMGPRPSPKHSIDRINNDGNYEPTNCRWALQKEQAQNTRRNVRIAFDGKCMTLSEWAEHLGLNRSLLIYRLRIGWPLKDVLSPKVRCGWYHRAGA